jgi:hypothetical protein
MAAVQERVESVFRRRRREASDDELDELEVDDEVDDVDDYDDDYDEDEYDDEAPPSRTVAVTDGPWDVADVADDDLPRLDLGGIRVPVPDGMEVRVDAQEDVIVAATLVDGASTMQVSAFAAPRSTGIWDEVRSEIAQSLTESGGSAQEAGGPFGTELHARVPTDVPGQGRVLQHARFVGIDGPRWFLRALLTGPAATDTVQAQRLEDAFRQVVVVRGAEAMAPRDPLPMRLPRDAAQSAEQPAKPTLDPFHRGPEITEVR